VPVPQIEINLSFEHDSITSVVNADVARMLITISASRIRSISSSGPEGLLEYARTSKPESFLYAMLGNMTAGSSSGMTMRGIGNI
jgi:hypothetical protein